MASLNHSPQPMVKMNKTCDQCRHRKIRCIVPDTPPGVTPTCVYCAKRGQSCNFSVFRRKVRVKVPEPLPASSRSQCKFALDDLFIDRLLQYGPQNIVLADEYTVFTAPDEKVPSSGLSFFSEQKVASLTEKIGNTRLQEIIQKLDDVVLDRLGHGVDEPTWPQIRFSKPNNFEWLSTQEAKLYIDAYFKNLHPVYPFLYREEFESQAYSPNLPELLEKNHAFSALYHAILALGSQFIGGGTFEPGKGKTWELFQVSLGYMADIILPRESIDGIQALAAMSIFALNTCTLQVDDIIIAHASRLVLTARYHKALNSEPKHMRVFWVIYALEKQMALHSRISSIIPDEDIGCIIPPFPEAEFGDFNWMIGFIRIGRIGSIVYTSLFSTSASLRTPESYQSTLEQVRRMLEDWRQSIPVEFRPGELTHFPKSEHSSVRLAALQMHCSYYNIIIALERLTLHLDREGGYKGQMSRQRLMNTARTVIELTRHIDIQPHTPIFVLAVLPLSALFILFDFVMHNPHHRESRTNLALLDSGAGYFSSIEIASNKALPGGIIPELAQIAREYYWKSQQANPEDTKLNTPPTDEKSSSKPVQVTSSFPATSTSGFPIAMNEPQDMITTLDSGPQEFVGPTQTVTPTGSDYLNYPTPMNFEAASDFQTTDTGDLRTIFGWVFPDWSMSGLDMEGFNLGEESHMQGGT